MGMAQWATASTGSPHLRAIAPAIAPRDYYWDIYYNEGGAQSLRATMTAALTWSLVGARRGLSRGELSRADYDRIVAGVRVARSRPDRLPLTDPALNIGGWFDHCLRATLDGYVTMRQKGGSVAARLCEGMLRARYRYSRTHTEPLVPGEVVELRLSLRATANVLLPGHRSRHTRGTPTPGVTWRLSAGTTSSSCP